jgi:glycosyltransferase involved in cell wall biosynthesis
MAFNEAESLAEVTSEIRDSLERLGRPWEMVIVNDGSADATGSIADGLASESSAVRAVHHPVNQGLGAVYRTGFAEVTSEFVTFLPADGQIPASSIAPFVAAMDAGADMVLGTIPDRPVPLYVRMLSSGERLLYRLLFGSFPAFQGMLMFRRSLLDAVELTSTGRGWTVIMELIVRTARRGASLAHVETGLDARRSGESKVTNLRTILSNFRQVLQLRWDL